MKISVENARVLKSNIRDVKDKVVFSLKIDLEETVEVITAEGEKKEVERVIWLFNYKLCEFTDKLTGELKHFIAPADTYSKSKKEHFPLFTCVLSDKEKTAIVNKVLELVKPASADIDV